MTREYNCKKNHNLIKMSCNICNREYDIMMGRLRDSLANQEIQSNCTHEFCTDCLNRFYDDSVVQCPICHENIWRLVSTYHNDTSESDDDGESDSESDDDTDINGCTDTESVLSQ